MTPAEVAGVLARNRWRSLAVLLVLLAATAFAVGLQGREAPAADSGPVLHPVVHPTAQPVIPAVVPPSTAPATAPSSPAAPRTSPRPAVPVPASTPVQLSIPSLHLSTRLLRLGVHKDGTVQVPAPADADLAGWFRLGPPPGQVGSAVILGHVDSLSGPAVFYELRFLVPGARVDVRLATGAVATFRVQRVRTYPNAEFPAREVYGSHGYPALQLVTCGGAYDHSSGYQANVVVYTRLVHTTPATA